MRKNAQISWLHHPQANRTAERKSLGGFQSIRAINDLVALKIVEVVVNKNRA